ncbi:hypothetical protein LPJ75_006276 [Coemansia sp. RSA 2598]|nr:hypothetical protein LPJ75_006276 [Coemansia sp. RSA 2598]
MDVSKAGDDFSDASMIIDMYADNQAQSKNNSLVSLHDSGYGSSGDSSIGKKDGFRVSEDLGDVEGVASDNHYKDAVKPLLSIYADSDIDAINAMLHSLPNTPSAEHFDKDGEHGSENDSEQRGGSALGQSQMLLARSRMSMQQELRQKLVRCLQDDYVNCIQDQEIKSSKLLSEAEERYKALLATKEKEFEQKLAEQEQKHKGDMERQSNEAKAQLEKLQTKVDELTAERDGLHNMLEDFVLTSTKLLDHREAENRNLSQELGRLTFENQQLQKKMEESRAHAQAMSKEHGEVQERVDVLVAENMRLETINSTLTGDVAIAEERNQKIKEHAEKTLQRANLEIEQLQQKASCLQQESAALRNRSSKADMRIKSLQIQLQSTQRQNDELLGLCERLEASTGVS